MQRRRRAVGLPHNPGMACRAQHSDSAAGPWCGVRRALAVLIGLCLLALAGCADTQYYWQSVHGHLRLMQAARPVAQWLGDPQTPEALKERLRLTQRLRDYAVAELALPDNPSYRSYADLHRPAVVWNVVAAPELSLTLHEWCFPVLGCVTYRGYFDEAAARREAAQLRARGLEVSVYGVPAYSTLGWMNWAGGDPLLNTFIHYPEGELARLLFHELAHQVLYAPGDTMFNESFATTVERLGGARWLQEQASEDARAQYAAFDARRHAFRALVLATRTQLEQIYRNAEALSGETQRQRKQQVMQDFRARYAALKLQWGGYAGYDNWVANANNASLGAQAAYDALVPQFESVFARQGGNWKAFYHAVGQIAELPQAERRAALERAGDAP